MVDIGRAFRGIGTGFLGGALAASETENKIKAEITLNAANKLFTETIPAEDEKIKNEKETFAAIEKMYDPTAANFYAEAGLITDDLTNSLALIDTFHSTDMGGGKTFSREMIDGAAIKGGGFQKYITGQEAKLEDKKEYAKKVLAGDFGDNTIDMFIQDLEPGVTAEEAKVDIETKLVDEADTGPFIKETAQRPEDIFKLAAAAEAEADLKEFRDWYTTAYPLDKWSGRAKSQTEAANSQEWQDWLKTKRDVLDGTLDASTRSESTLRELVGEVLMHKKRGFSKGAANDYAFLLSEMGLSSGDIADYTGVDITTEDFKIFSANR